MEEATCCYCKSTNGDILANVDGFTIIKCECGITYPNPRYSPEELIEMYNKNEYTDANKKSDTHSYLEIEKDNEVDLRRRLKLVESFSKRKGKLLDVGCNIGSLIKVADGWICYGLDLNESSIKIARERGLNCDVKRLEKVKGKYDLIFMNDFLEHVNNPIELIKKSWTLLNKGGYIYISTPDGDSLVSKISRGRWLHRKPEQHLYIFTRGIIKDILEKNGFDVIYISSIGRIRSLGVIIKKIKSYSNLIGNLLDYITPQLIKNISISINPLDEMQIIGRKNGSLK